MGVITGVVNGGVILTGPSADGTSGQFLRTNGSGALSFASVDTSSLVTGAASSTDNALPRFDGTTGKTLQGSGVIVDDSNNVTGIAAITVSGVAAFQSTLWAMGGQLDIGGSCRIINSPANKLYLDNGGGAALALQLVGTYGAPDASGSNTAATNTTIVPGRSTGNATPAKVKLQGTTAGASGSSAQTLSDVLTVHSATQLEIAASAIDFSALPTANPAVAGRLWNDSGTVKISAG